MENEIHQEYDEELTTLLEVIWGEGFLSPGGTAAVDQFLEGVELAGKRVLDIGCGTGGVDVHIGRCHPGAQVLGVDIDPYLIDRCHELAARSGVTTEVGFQLVEPGVLPFEPEQFDVVISKDSILHIEDKLALAQDVFRVLKPGGTFAASDWLGGYEGEPSPEMQAYIDAEGLGFDMASGAVYSRALQQAGFSDVTVTDRNAWYREEARRERDALTGHLTTELISSVGREFVDHQIEVWNLMIVALDQGQLRPSLLRAQKPT